MQPWDETQRNGEYVFVSEHDAVLRGVLHTRYLVLESAEYDYDNGAFLSVISVEVNELLERITTRYITR